ncbi:unnamed protein product [Amoebophrya sp. A120]|nr:unnamed protein product [Amoebophrya sp. A120]|eukprot:GSA120T00025062001.1
MSVLQRIADIENEMARTQKNKATNGHLGLLKAKLAKLRGEVMAEASKSGGGGGQGFEVKATGNARVGLIGFPSVGKSTLLNRLTGAESEVASYEFTTLTCIPGTFTYKGAKVQVLDLPGIIEGAKDGKGRGKQIISVAMTCSLILVVLDSSKPWSIRQKIEKELYGFGMRLNKARPNITIVKGDKGGITVNVKQGCELIDTDIETVAQIAKEYRIINANIHIACNATIDEVIDVFENNRKYVSCLYLMNKVDLISQEELQLMHEDPNMVPICASEQWCLDMLIERMWRRMDLVRCFTKPKQCNPDFAEPVILSKKHRRVEDFCLKIHKTLLEQFKHALVWGASTKHNPQTVGKDHLLEDGDVVEIVKKVG